MRQRLSLDHNWRFQLSDQGKISRQLHRSWYAKAGGVGGAPAKDFDDSHWEQVNLPHDWAVELPFDHEKDQSQEHIFHGFKPIGPLYPDTSIGWYRKTLDIPESDSGKRLFLEFGGVFRDSIVWLNGHYLGRHGSGYTSFQYDISDVVDYGEKNTLAVRVDATHHEGWWYEGAGIYRHVWLVKTAPVHIKYCGTFITSKIKGKSAQVTVRTKLLNQSDDPIQCQLTSTAQTTDGRQVACASVSVNLEAWQSHECTQEFEIKNPQLWDIDSPVLYRLLSSIEIDSEIVDEYETPIGIRNIRFDADKGFFLNGRHVVLKGVCGHPDHAGLGSALPDGMHEFRLNKLKEMGVNAVRSQHCCSTSEWLDACDRLGIMVLDEHRLFGSAAETLDELESMVVRDRNHPSIILWSLGNEEFVQSSDVGARIAKTMQRLVKKLDPTRLTTFGANNDGTETGINSVVDVRGWNYMYHGGVDEYHKRNPNQPIIILEEASTLCTRGEYVDDSDKCYVSAYDEHPPDRGTNVWMSAEEWWTYFVARPYLAGGFVWTGFDYAGEPTPYWKWPCVGSHFGVMDYCGFPKDNYYYYQSWWSDRTVLHIFPHWNWPDRQGQMIDVRCFSNCDAVELFVNGKCFGRKPIPRNSHLKWLVEYQPGMLEAKGYKGNEVIATKIIETTGNPASVRMIPHRNEIKADRQDISVVDVEVIDSQGRAVPTASNDIHFEITGSGQIIGVGNGNPTSHELAKANRRKAFNGLCQVIIQATEKSGIIELEAVSKDLKTSSLKIKSL